MPLREWLGSLQNHVEKASSSLSGPVDVGEISVASWSMHAAMLIQIAKLREHLNTEMKVLGMQLKEVDGLPGVYNALGSFSESQIHLLNVRMEVGHTCIHQVPCSIPPPPYSQDRSSLSLTPISGVIGAFLAFYMGWGDLNSGSAEPSP